MVATSSVDGRARRTALARGLALAPEQPQLLFALAHLDAADGRWDETLLLATKASQVGDGGRALPLRLRALAHVGRCAEAADLSRALEMLAPAVAGGTAQRDWQNLRQTCSEAAARVQAAPTPAPTDVASP